MGMVRTIPLCNLKSAFDSFFCFAFLYKIDKQLLKNDKVY